MLKKFITILLALSLGLMLFGCGESSSESSEADLSALVRIGTQEGAYVYELAIENRSGYAISALSVKCEKTQEFTGNALKDDSIGNGELRMLCFAAAAPALDKEEYAISLVLGRDLFRNLHCVPFSQTDRCVLLSDGDYCYLEYRTASGETVSTKELEKSFYEAENSQNTDNDGCIGDGGLVY